ncbi:MAG: S8 family serine peptidase [Planctomycetes bacterium]|nr:S8 family serine peptidase [Planctomycetota bacterium]
MSTLTRKALLCAWLPLVFLFGCGAQQAGAPADDSNVSADPPFVFNDDLEPATAALPYVEDELLVQPYPGADVASLHALYAEAGAEVIAELSEIELTALSVPAGGTDQVAAHLAASGLIEGVHRNYIYQAQATPNDPLFLQQPHLAQVAAPEAWDITSGSPEVIIAIVDTGVDASHPDLADKIIEGWNVYDNNGDFSDVAGHGTLAAGIAAASSNNAAGVAGLSWSSPLLAVRATDPQGQSTGRHLAAGILWAAGHGARVINVSFAPLWSNTVVQSAAVQAFNRGALVVIAAGNGGGSTAAPGYPEAVFVGAVDGSDAIASFSDRGPFVDLVAPGTSVRSTTIGSEYGAANGTSFAAPIVSGVAALVWSVNPELRPSSVANALTTSVVDLGTSGRDNTFGHGEVNAHAAVALARRFSETADHAAPTLRIDRLTSGTQLTSRTTVSVTASDDVGVADVVLSIDGRGHATDTRVPYQFVLDPVLLSVGDHELSFSATDVAGRQSAPQSIMVRVGTPPTSSANTPVSGSGVFFRSPKEGAAVSGNVTISATVSSDAGVATVEWFVDGDSMFVSAVSGTSSGVSYVWRSAGASSGAHVITAVLTDGAGSQYLGRLNLVLR